MTTRNLPSSAVYNALRVARAASGIALLILLSMATGFAVTRCTRRALSPPAGPIASAVPTPPNVPLGSPAAPSAAGGDDQTSAGGLEPSPVVQAGEPEPVGVELSGPDLSDLLPAFELESVEPGFLPTEEGLRALTLEQYRSPGFLDVTRERAMQLLPLDDSIASWPDDVRALIGGELPTEDDVARGFRSEAVRARLQDVNRYDLVLFELELVPFERRALGFDEAYALLRRQRSSACLELCLELERATGYPYWTTLQRLREAWAK